MDLTPYHAKYFAYELTKRCPPDSVEKLAGALADAQVDLNPHQIDAALFAFRSPLSRGAILADEVGLGKTIEAGLVLSQRWAERKRRILVITPANLRKQWYQELTEKFFLPCRILETKSYNAAVKQAQFRPFDAPEIVICSYHFARSKADDVRTLPWDLVVIDEAHRLRNVYKPSNVIANTLKLALAGKHKLLLTATPLQNSLLELFGLVSFVDEHTFGDLGSFREQFANLSQQQVFQTLKARLKPVCHRTLRRQVLPYIKYTERHPIVQPFTPEESEDRLYDLVSEYLQRDNLQALPPSQRSLMTLVLRKLLASSTFAIAGALTTISNRLKARLRQQEPAELLGEELNQDYEGLDETAEEWADDEDAEPLSAADRAAIEREIAELDDFARLATSIEHNAKGKALLTALEIGFAKAGELGAAQKAVIFTESRRTQSYLLRVLADGPFAQGIVLFNGSNSDERSREIYAEWLRRHEGTDRVSGSRTADLRSALVDYFREQGRIMIATEAGAEGINLQFCSLVVNYDLPWNPQRIEQRIGRCHRYGQQHDVAVVNFLNTHNAADQRVFQLLSEKFKLFEGVFGASDEVLGAIESGVDFEKRIAGIYQRCRRPDEIQAAFDQLQLELGLQIDESLSHTRQQLLENFDDEVREKLRVRDADSKAYLNRFERLLMQLTRHELNGHAHFLNDSSFQLKSRPFPEAAPDIALGLYELPRRSGEAYLYRLTHPLAEAVLAQAKERSLPHGELLFDYSGYGGRITVLEPFVGQRGVLDLAVLTVEALDQIEDHLLLVAQTGGGTLLDDDQASRLFTLPGRVEAADPLTEADAAHLRTQREQRQGAILARISDRNGRFFQQEMDKLDQWADDVRLSLRRQLKELDDEVVALRRQARQAGTVPEKVSLQRQVNQLEAKRDQAWREYDEAARGVDRQKNDLLDAVERTLQQRVEMTPLFTVRWRLV
jgi:superfamily II DNA or RNA helicase